MKKNLIDDLVQTVKESDYKVMLALEDKVFYDDDKEALTQLRPLCQKYGFTAKEFIEWCEE